MLQHSTYTNKREKFFHFYFQYESMPEREQEETNQFKWKLNWNSYKKNGLNKN